MPRSVVRQMSKSPRFTALDFYIPPGGVDLDVPLRGRAVQVLTTLDYNHFIIPTIDGTDTENCHQVWNGQGLLNTVGMGAGVLNPAGDTATWAAGVLPAVNGLFQIVTTSAMPGSILTVPVLVGFAALSAPGGTPVICTITTPAPFTINFPGGPAGVYNLDIPTDITATVSPAVPGDATVTGTDPALPLLFNAESVLESVCESTWAQPATGPVPTSRVGYVHLNRAEPHLPMPPIGVPGQSGFQTVQAVPIPTCPALIRVEQEFDWLRIESASTLALPLICAGIVIVEHETEKEVIM